MMNLLIPGEAGQRALEETMADWRESRVKAHGAVRVWREVQGVVSVVRVVVGVGLREMTYVASIRSAAITVGIALIPTAIFALIAFDALVSVPSRAFVLPTLAVLTTLVLPVVATFGFGWKRVERPPVLGSLSLVVIVQLVFLTLVIPATHVLMEPYWREFIRTVELQTKTVIEIRPLPTGGEFLLSARGLAVIAAIPVLTLFGAAVRRSLGNRAYWVRQAVTGLALTALITGVYSAWLWLDSLVLRYWPRQGLIPEALWSIVVLAAIVTLVLARMVHPKRNDRISVNPE